MDVTGTINDILNRKGFTIWSISPEATVFQAIQLMADKNIGALLVLDQGTLLGIISERDYTRKVILKGKSSKQTRVREIMSGEILTANSNQTIEDGLRLMTEKRVRHLPILNGTELVGIISIGDLVNWIISAQRDTILHLENYITGKYPG